MKLNSTVLLTLILLTLMLGAGSVSAFWGFTLGSAALKGVTAPDARPTSKFARKGTSGGQDKESVVFVKESEILKIVKSRIEGKTKASAKSKEFDELEEGKKKTKRKREQKPPASEEKLQAGFPITDESEGVTLSVQSARYSGGALMLRVKMDNKSDDSVRFLYSFLDVTDDKGRTLSASTEGLPSELTSNGSAHFGTVSIPTALLDDVKRISLALTDYPAQKLRLEVSNIPVEK